MKAMLAHVRRQLIDLNQRLIRGTTACRVRSAIDGSCLPSVDPSHRRGAPLRTSDRRSTRLLVFFAFAAPFPRFMREDYAKSPLQAIIDTAVDGIMIIDASGI